MGLEVGGIFAKAGVRVDDRGFNDFDRRMDRAEHRARRGITTKADVDTDKARKGFADYERQVDRADRSHSDFVRGSGRVRGAMGSLVLGGAGLAAGTLAFGALAKGALGAVSAFKESEVIGKRTANVLESTGHAAGVTRKEVEDLAGALSRKSGVDDEVIQSGENVLLTFTNVRNEVGKGNDIFSQATGLALDMSRALGTDLQGANIQLGKALNDPVKGITALSRVGVSFTKGQKDQIKTLVEHGKTVDAQKVILGELRKEFGGAAAASATWGDRLKVTFGNLQEAVGKRLAPIFDAGAKALDGFVSGMQDGTGAGGRFVTQIKGLAAGAKTAIAGLVDGGKAVVTFFRGNHDAQGWLHNIAAAARDAWRNAQAAGRGIAAAFKGVDPELATIGRAVLKVLNVFSSFYGAVVRRQLPGMVQSLRGLANIVRGIVQIVAGLLSGDFGKAWEGAKRVVSGFASAVAGSLRSLTAPFRELVSRATDAGADLVKGAVGKAKRLPGALWDVVNPVNGRIATLRNNLYKRAGEAGVALVRGLVGEAKSLPGKVAGLGHDAVHALAGLPGNMASLGRRAVDAILDAFTGLAGKIAGKIKSEVKSVPGKIGGKVGGLAKSLDPTGLLKRYGGRVGPTAGGARAFIAGEGGLDEWVISQEGDRGQNVAWAREALETLTGRDVGLYAGGKPAKKKRKKRKALKPLLGSGQISSATGEQERGLANFDRDLERLNRRYGQLDRENSLSEEELVVEHDDGTTTVDKAAVAKRVAELEAQIAFLRDKIGAKLRDYKAKAKAAVGVYDTIIKRLNRAIGRAHSSRRKNERTGYVTKRSAYIARRAELADKVDDLDIDIDDNRLDIAELGGEEADVAGTKAPPPPPPDDTAAAAIDVGGADTTVDVGAATDVAVDAPAAEPVAAAPTALEVAEAAAAQVRAYDAGRADLLSTMARGNFMAPGALSGPLTAEEQAAGARYFGAGGAGAPDGAGVLRQAGGVTQHVHLTVNSEGEAHTFTQAALHELQAAV